MRFFLPWQLVVALTFFLDVSSESELPIPPSTLSSGDYYDYGVQTSESELPNPSTDPNSSETSDEKPVPTKFSSMQYGSACINIYDSRTTLNNKIIFFYSPIGQLNHKDTVFFFNETANQGLISLSYSIWNEVVGIKVARHLTQALNQEVEPNQVKVFPFDSVWLTSIAQSSGDFSLTNERLTYKDEQSLRFSLTCLTYEDCDQVKAKIRSNPEQFENLKLYFSPLWNDYYCFPDGVEISQEDEFSIKLEELDKRLEETKLNFNFIKELTKTNHKLLENIETKLAKDLDTIREETTQRIKSESTLTVESLSSIIVGNSEIFQESVNASHVAVENLKAEQKETKKDLAAISQLLANKMNITEENLAVTFANLEATRNELIQTKTTVEELSAKLNGNSEILHKSANVSQVAVENLKTDQKETKNDLIAISQFLATKMNVTEENLAVTFANLEATRNELTQTKTTVDELSAKLKGTKQELEKTRDDLIKTVDDLSTKLNSTIKELGEMKIIDENLSTELKVTKQKLEKTGDDLTNSVNYATKLNSVEKQLAGMKIIDENLSTQLEANSRRLSYELKVTEENIRQELRATSNHLESATTNLNRTRTELSNTNTAVSDLTNKFNARTSEIVDIGKMPTSCSDLKRMGHKLSGFFSVKGSKKLETVFCDFYPNQNDLQKWIGYADVKSAPVHFFVQKTSSFVSKDSPIPFEISVVNLGNAMNAISGIFTAPRKGIYYFSFTGNAGFPASSSDTILVQVESKTWRASSVYLRVFLYKNGSKMAVGNVQEANTVAKQHSPFIVQSTLELNSGDRVWLQIDGMSPGTVLHDDKDYKFNHFTGFMLDEEIVASL